MASVSQEASPHVGGFVKVVLKLRVENGVKENFIGLKKKGKEWGRG